MSSFSGHPREIASWLGSQDQGKRFEVKELKPKRSLTQNAYYWAMVNKLSRTLGISDSETHAQMLREYGVCDVVLLRADVNAGDFFEYYDEYDAGHIRGVAYKQVKAYKRSSRMDSAEFSALIDGLRFECEQQGIGFMTPEEVSRLRFVEPERD